MQYSCSRKHERTTNYSSMMVRVVSEFRDDAFLGSLEELDDVTDFGAVGHLIFDLVHRIEDACLSVEHESIGIGDVLDDLFIDAVRGAHRLVHPTVCDGHASGDDVGRDVLREGGARLYHSAFANACSCVGDDARREDGPVVYLTFAGDLGAIAKDAPVAHFDVVRDVHALHQEVVVADDGLSAGMRSAVDHHVLSYDVVMADDTLRSFASEVEVLWQRTDDGTLVNLVMAAHTGAVEDADEGEDDASLANLHVAFDIDEGENLAVVAYFRPGVDFGFLTNITHVYYELRMN